MRLHRHFFAAVTGLAFLASGVLAQAQNVSTDPVGGITLTLAGGSDTDVSLPFHRPVALETQVVSISGNTITVSASANLTAGEFVYVAGTQTNTYYLQFTSGNRSGMYYTVTTNDGSSITVDANGDTDLDANVNPGDTFRVIPYWTLNTLFPNGQGLYPSPSLTPASTILIPPSNSPGINLSAAGVYYYYTGSGGPDWLQLGNLSSTFPDVILPPDSFFTVRHPPSSADTQLVLVGNVPMSPQAIVLNTLAPNTPQDNSIALPVPISVTLAGSGLSSVIAPSPTLTPTDQLLVYDPTVDAQNKSATATYFYYTGAGGPGWLQVGNLSGFQDSNAIFQPGYGYVLRRAAQPEPTSAVWTFTPPYLSDLSN